MPSKIGNQPNIEVIAYHGWGFDSSFWNDWGEFLPVRVNFKTADRGYFLEEKLPRFSQDSSQKIIFLHSYGLHWCPPELLAEADYIVIFNGFLQFHPPDSPDTRKSKRVLNKMISKFEKSPRQVLNSFWKNSFFPHQTRNIPSKKFDQELLLNDLKKLQTSTFNLKPLHDGKPIISLDGGHDKILTTSRGKSFTDFTEGNAVYHFIQEGGHALPATHTQDCWSFISAMIPIFQNNGNNRKRRN